MKVLTLDTCTSREETNSRDEEHLKDDDTDDSCLHKSDLASDEQKDSQSNFDNVCEGDDKEVAKGLEKNSGDG